MTDADLERLWRPSEDFIGPVGPPMVIAARQPGYLANEWSLGPYCVLIGRKAAPAAKSPPPVGHQFELNLEAA